MAFHAEMTFDGCILAILFLVFLGAFRLEYIHRIRLFGFCSWIAQAALSVYVFAFRHSQNASFCELTKKIDFDCLVSSLNDPSHDCFPSYDNSIEVEHAITSFIIALTAFVFGLLPIRYRHQRHIPIQLSDVIACMGNFTVLFNKILAISYMSYCSSCECEKRKEEISNLESLFLVLTTGLLLIPMYCHLNEHGTVVGTAGDAANVDGAYDAHADDTNADDTDNTDADDADDTDVEDDADVADADDDADVEMGPAAENEEGAADDIFDIIFRLFNHDF